jgi:MFS family permease
VAPRLARALRHRNYRLFFAGQSISLIGTWLTRFATVWMVYRLTKSPVMLGLVGFFGQAPAAVLAPIAGVLVDRWNVRRTLIVTQIAAMLQSAALALFALGGWMTVWHLLVLGAVQAVINAFDTVARQSFVGQMIEDRADLPNAIALNSSMVNIGRLVGPVLAAVLVDLFGEGWCFTIDAASYIAVIASLLAMRVVVRPRSPRRAVHIGRELREGLTYVAERPLVRSVLLLFAATSVLAGSYQTLLPLVAGEHLHGGPHTLGILMGASGLGALASALYLASRTSSVGLERLVAACSFGLAASLVLLELADSTLAAVPILFSVGVCLMMQPAATNTIVQTNIEPDRIGRVMSLYVMAFFGGAPLGALAEGQLAKMVGAVHAFAIAGVCVAACGFAFVRDLRRQRRARSQIDCR